MIVEPNSIDVGALKEILKGIPNNTRVMFQYHPEGAQLAMLDVLDVLTNKPAKLCVLRFGDDDLIEAKELDG